MFDGAPTDPWPLALLGLRIAAVGLLYLFLATAFRALRADLRASSAPERARTGYARAATPVAAGRRSATVEAYPDRTYDEEYDGWEDDWDEEWEPESEAAPTPGTERRAPRRGFRRPAVWLPVAAAVLVAAFGGTAMFLADDDPGAPPADQATGQQESNDPSEPPAVAPDPGRVTIGLAATEDAQVRVTVDGVVEFDGLLRRGERQAWEGAERIQVWTDSGKTVQLAVNGVDLGAYSPAMGHPDWNRIDYGFWPGWAP